MPVMTTDVGRLSAYRRHSSAVTRFDFKMLHEIDAVHLETPERFFELGVRRFGGTAVDLGHHKGAVAISFAQRLAQAFLARAFVIVPGVIHEGDAVVDRGADDANGQR